MIEAYVIIKIPVHDGLCGSKILKAANNFQTLASVIFSIFSLTEAEVWMQEDVSKFRLITLVNTLILIATVVEKYNLMTYAVENLNIIINTKGMKSTVKRI